MGLSGVLVATGTVSGLWALPVAAATPELAVGSESPTQQAKPATDQSISTTSSADQDSSEDGDEKKKVKTLGSVVVTGSLIPQSQSKTFAPTIELDAAELERSGFTSVHAALSAQPLATGSVTGNQSASSSFTAGAETVSLLGLSPSFTMYMINGHPIADYPLLYGGQSSFVDLSTIPMGMVQRIDIVPGNMSSIYGSGAIAGVVNIILKDQVDGFELDVRGGTYTGGGGQNEQISFLGGYANDRFSMIYSAQLSNQDGIWAYQRDQTRSQLSNPDPSLRYGYPIFVDQYLSSSYDNVYQDPGDQCSKSSYLYDGTTGRTGAPRSGAPIDPDTGMPTGTGYYCGTPYLSGYQTLLNYKQNGAGYLDMKYTLDENTELYANVLYNVSKNESMYGYNFWQANYSGTEFNNSGLFWNENTDQWGSMWRFFSPEETGDWRDTASAKYRTRSYNGWVGIRGDVSDYHYDLSYSRSQQSLDQRVPWLLTDKVNGFFEENVMGPLLGTTSGYPIYAPNMDSFYTPLTPAQYASINGIQRDHNKTWRQSLDLQITNGDLFELPGGSAGFAAVLQYGQQMWSNPTDPRVLDGDFYGLTGTSGEGKREFWAAAGELRAPLTDKLVAGASIRHDNYSDDGGGGDSSTTYKLGLEFRPFESLLLRGNYSTAFRAPDMPYVHGGKSGSFYSGQTDYYRCDLYGGPLTDCPYYVNQPVFGLSTGSKDLKSVTAKSFGYGVIWSATKNLNFKADYYNVDISDEVQIQSVEELLRTEADCRSGQFDISSTSCVAALNQIERAPATGVNRNQLRQVAILPINVANERVSGLMASADYWMRLGRFGGLTFNVGYNVTLNHEFQERPDSDATDLLGSPERAPYSREFKTVTNASVAWDVGQWNVTLYGTRYGATANYAAYNLGYGNSVEGSYNGQAGGKVAPWILYNASVSYNITPDLLVRATVNNALNTMPPRDRSHVAWPYYNNRNFDVYGRAIWLQANWKFGGG